MQTALKSLSIIILNYKDARLTANCVIHALQSIQHAQLLTEIIVIDNSARETARSLRQLLPDNVVLFECENNTGYAGGNNIGIRLAKGEYILLLNNDVFLESDTIETGIKYLQDNPRIGIWAPRLVGPDGQLQLSCAKFHSILGLMGEYLFNTNLDLYRGWPLWASPHLVDAVTGAFFLTRKDVIERIGLLDEGYFFNVEDIDYCRRTKSAGFGIVYDPRVSAVHLRGASQETKTWALNTQLHKNRIRYIYKHHGIFIGLLARIIINLGIMVRKIHASL